MSFLSPSHFLFKLCDNKTPSGCDRNDIGNEEHDGGKKWKAIKIINKIEIKSE